MNYILVMVFNTNTHTNTTYTHKPARNYTMYQDTNIQQTLKYTEKKDKALTPLRFTNSLFLFSVYCHHTHTPLTTVPSTTITRTTTTTNKLTLNN